MELWQEDAKMPSLFCNLLYKRLLGPKTRLALQDFLCATEWIVRRTVILACHLKLIFSEAMFNKETWCMPLGWFRNSGWSYGKLISWRNLMPSRINHLFCMFACLPPGWKLIWETRSTSLEYAEWPWELSTRMRAWYLGPWRHSKVGIILLWSWIEIDEIKLKDEIKWLACVTNISPVQ